MATKSILKTVTLNSGSLARGLAAALENAEKKSSKEVVLRRSLEEVKSEDIPKFFNAQ